MDQEGYNIETHLTFPRLWGLGTSSTLINSIGDWLDIDAFELLQKSFGEVVMILPVQNRTHLLYII